MTPSSTTPAIRILGGGLQAATRPASPAAGGPRNTPTIRLRSLTWAGPRSSWATPRQPSRCCQAKSRRCAAGRLHRPETVCLAQPMPPPSRSGSGSTGRVSGRPALVSRRCQSCSPSRACCVPSTGEGRCPRKAAGCSSCNSPVGQHFASVDPALPRLRTRHLLASLSRQAAGPRRSDHHGSACWRSGRIIYPHWSGSGICTWTNGSGRAVAIIEHLRMHPKGKVATPCAPGPFGTGARGFPQSTALAGGGPGIGCQCLVAAPGA